MPLTSVLSPKGIGSNLLPAPHWEEEAICYPLPTGKGKQSVTLSPWEGDRVRGRILNPVFYHTMLEVHKIKPGRIV
jgi:hypothetical protein